MIYFVFLLSTFFFLLSSSPSLRLNLLSCSLRYKFTHLWLNLRNGKNWWIMKKWWGDETDAVQRWSRENRRQCDELVLWTRRKSGGRRRTCDELVLWTMKWIFTGAWDDSVFSGCRAMESEIEKRKMKIRECVQASRRWRRDEWEVTGSGHVIRRCTGGDKSGGSPEIYILYLLYFVF